MALELAEDQDRTYHIEMAHPAAEERPRYPRVQSPFSLEGIDLPNRIVRTAHGTGLATEVVSDELIAFHQQRAAGGVGLLIVGDGIVHPSAKGVLSLWREEAVPGMENLGAAVHAEGAAIFQQLSHQGAAAMGENPPWGPSSIPIAATGRSPVAMTRAMIESVVEGFATSARRCREAGYDGVEVHAGHGFLVAQFLSPLLNDRTDEYGGELANRFLFLRQVLTAIRSEVGHDFVIGTRVSVSEQVFGGLEPADTLEIVGWLEKEQLVDFVDLSSGHLINYDPIIGGMHFPRGYQVPASASIAEHCGLPTICAGRVHTLDEAEHILATTECDLVALTRSTIADPDLVKRSIEGRPAEVRPCIACNVCLAAMNAPARRISCAVNPLAARELVLPPLSAAPSPRRVLVVGGGPAGLEAVRVASARGHDVVLCDREQQLGGAVRVAGLAPHRADIVEIVEWQERQVVDLGVDIRRGSEVDAALVDSLAPDVVVLATGGQDRMDGLQIARPSFRPSGVSQAHVLSASALHRCSGLTPATAVVLDDIGGYEAVGAAEQLARGGARVTFVTRFPEIGAGLGPTLEREPAQRRLEALGVRVMPHALVESIGPTSVMVSSLRGEGREEIAAEAVVLVSTRTPRSELVPSLENWGGEFRVVGDAVSSRDLAAAILEGFQAGAAV
jgi:2,4-dienoyl-CoA reductase-like NADH-dependent reductase (Old Yellow Enzyme family)/thioredoxin reductase